MQIIDFNKEQMNLSEYTVFVEHVLNHSCKAFRQGHMHAQEVVDDVVDYLMKYDKKYRDTTGASRSTFRWMICKRRAFYVINKMQEKHNRIHKFCKHKVKNKRFDYDDHIESGENKRVYDIAMAIIERRRKENIKFQCFYESVVQGKRGTEIARIHDISTTLVGQHIAYVKNNLKKELTDLHGADCWT